MCLHLTVDIMEQASAVFELGTVECLKPLVAFVLLSLVKNGFTTDNSELKDYCDVDTFHAQCANGEVVLMQEATYGRMELGTCLVVDLGFMGCFRDILSYMDKQCSGRTSCHIPVRDLIILTNPCISEVRNYLQASFTCIPVVEHGDNCCRFQNDQVHVTAGSGYLASIVTLDTGCGSRDCPWLLEASQGQRINISIYDFGLYGLDNENAGITDSGGHCDVYATVTEVATGASVTVCGGGKRKRHLYTSKTNSIQIYFDEQSGNERDFAHFIMEYRVFRLANGCDDPPIPSDALIHREGDHVTISCPAPSDVIWEMICRDGQWVGSYGNCSLGPFGNGDAAENPNNSIRFEPRMIIILIVAVAVILAIAIIIIGVMCVLSTVRSRKFRYSNETQSRVYEPHVKGYDGTLLGERDHMKSAKRAGIPHYLSDWNKHSTPYISSPTLLTGNDVVCDSESIEKLPYRDRSLSVGNNEFEHLDPVSATYATDAKTDCEYKTHIS